MSFFKNMFGKKDPIDEMRQFQTQKDWAGLLSATKRVDRSDLDEEVLSEINTWQKEAGDALATLNLEEGLWAQKSGNLLRAREDYQLAIEQARSDALRERIEQALATWIAVYCRRKLPQTTMARPSTLVAVAVAQRRQAPLWILRRWISTRKLVWNYCWPPCRLIWQNVT